jgi:hypothetical protein
MAKFLDRLKALNPICRCVATHLAEGAALRDCLTKTAFPRFNHVKDLRHVRNPR